MEDFVGYQQLNQKQWDLQETRNYIIYYNIYPRPRNFQLSMADTLVFCSFLHARSFPSQQPAGAKHDAQCVNNVQLSPRRQRAEILLHHSDRGSMWRPPLATISDLIVWITFLLHLCKFVPLKFIRH